MHCLGCGKAFKEHTILAQHLKDKHHGRNADTTNTRAGMTLGDIMAQAQAKRAAAPAKTAATERHQKQYSAFTPGDSRGMREYLKVCFYLSAATACLPNLLMTTFSNVGSPCHRLIKCTFGSWCHSNIMPTK